MKIYVLEFEKQRIEFLTMKEAVKFATENNIKSNPFEFEKVEEVVDIIEPTEEVKPDTPQEVLDFIDKLKEKYNL